MYFLFIACLVVIGTTSVSAKGTVTAGYGVTKGTFTDNTCTTAISYAYAALGCYKTSSSASAFYSADVNGNLVQTLYSSIDCSGTLTSENLVTQQACTCATGGSCTKTMYFAGTTPPVVSGPTKTIQQYEGATDCTGPTPTSTIVIGLDPTDSNTRYCQSNACSTFLTNGVTAPSVTTCAVTTTTASTTGFIQELQYKVCV